MIPHALAMTAKYMKMNTMAKLLDCLKNETSEIHVDPEIAEKARRPIERMLEISAKIK